MPQALIALALECVKLSLEIALEVIRRNPEAIDLHVKALARLDRDIVRFRKMVGLDDPSEDT